MQNNGNNFEIGKLVYNKKHNICFMRFGTYAYESRAPTMSFRPTSLVVQALLLAAPAKPQEK